MVEKRYSNDNRARERQKERKEQKGKKKKKRKKRKEERRWCDVVWCGVIRQDKTKCIIVGEKIEVSDVTVYCALHIMALTLSSVLH